ncbi:hypothetical protein HYN69_08500 [Gemmobacter aquarius]|uniref:Threonine/homoserine/homoserine lactone efflux protein n=1 Tax=Paragemmobacter aquarius TaxID=2169400 RepID=A0A2S0UL78_9RHOB|nr:hypothetical protein [Gemmobacter aquarius]AWB48546.1 hypothetical protein HYN69_08500 [Gemmobacter aquarius]
MPTAALLLALLGLLLTPGPTNTLMLLAGSDRGFRATLRLIPVELAAYLLTVTPLLLLAGAAAPHLAAMRPAIALVAGVWVLLLALTLWRGPAEGHGVTVVTPRHLFVTTLLNPKALIFGLVLLPGAPPVTGLTVFALLVVGTALLWAGLGAVLPRTRAASPIAFRRAAACWLALVSFGILANGFSA